MFTSSFASSNESDYFFFPVGECNAADFLIVPMEQQQILDSLPGWQATQTAVIAPPIAENPYVKSNGLVLVDTQISVSNNTRSGFLLPECTLDDQNYKLSPHERSKSLPNIICQADGNNLFFSQGYLMQHNDVTGETHASNTSIRRSISNEDISMSAVKDDQRQSSFPALDKFRQCLADNRKTLSKIRQLFENDGGGGYNASSWGKDVRNGFQMQSHIEPMPNGINAESDKVANQKRSWPTHFLQNNELAPKKFKMKIFEEQCISEEANVCNLKITNVCSVAENASSDNAALPSSGASNTTPLANVDIPDSQARHEMPYSVDVPLKNMETSPEINSSQSQRCTNLVKSALMQKADTYVLGEETQNACLKISGNDAFTSSDSSVALTRDASQSSVTSPLQTSQNFQPVIKSPTLIYLESPKKSQVCSQQIRILDSQMENNSMDLFGSAPVPVHTSTQVPSQLEEAHIVCEAVDDDDLDTANNLALFRIVRQMFNIPKPKLLPLNPSQVLPINVMEGIHEETSIFTPLQVTRMVNLISQLYP